MAGLNPTAASFSPGAGGSGPPPVSSGGQPSARPGRQKHRKRARPDTAGHSEGHTTGGGKGKQRSGRGRGADGNAGGGRGGRGAGAPANPQKPGKSKRGGSGFGPGAKQPGGSGGSAGEGQSKSTKSRPKGKARGNPSPEYTVQKRFPQRLPQAKNDLYVGRNSQFAVQLKQATRVLEHHPSIRLHALGAAIGRAITLGCRLQQQLPYPLELSAETSTVALVDDLIPSDPSVANRSGATPATAKTQVRHNSAIHITLTKSATAATNTGPSS